MRCSRPVCDRLAEKTRETVTVAVLDGDDAIIVHQSNSGSSALSVDWSGRHTPLHATAAGKIFLHYMPEEQRRRILKGPLRGYTKNTIVDPETLAPKHGRTTRRTTGTRRRAGGRPQRDRRADTVRRRRGGGRGERIWAGVPAAFRVVPEDRRAVRQRGRRDLSPPGIPGLKRPTLLPGAPLRGPSRDR